MNRGLRLADRLLYRVESLLNMMGGIVILLLVLLATVNVLGRWILSLPISGYVDWVEQSMAFMAFLGIAYTQRHGEHIRMDIVISRISGIYLLLLECISVFMMLAITLILTYGAYLHFLRAYLIGDSSLDIQLPIWPSKLVVSLALGILAMRLLLQFAAYLSLMTTPASNRKSLMGLIGDMVSAKTSMPQLFDEVKEPQQYRP